MCNNRKLSPLLTATASQINGKFSRRIGEQIGKASWSNSRKLDQNRNLKYFNVVAFNVSAFSSEKKKNETKTIYRKERVFVSEISVRHFAALLPY